MGYKNSRSLPIEGHLVQSSCFCETSGRHATPQYCRRCYVGMYVCFLIILIWWDDKKTGYHPMPSQIGLRNDYMYYGLRGME